VYDSIINKTPLSYRTNRIIGGVAPSEYVRKLEAGNSTSPAIASDRLDSYLTSHFIDPVVLRADDFQSFMADRQARLLALIERAMGKSAYAGPQQEEGEDVDGDSDAIEAKLTIDADPQPSGAEDRGEPAEWDEDEDEDEDPEATRGGGDRAMWERRVGSDIMRICDHVADIANEIARPSVELHYQTTRVSLSPRDEFFNVAVVFPKQRFVAVRLKLSDGEDWVRRLEDAGIRAWFRRSGGFIVVRIGQTDLHQNEPLIRGVVHQRVREFQA
jgi:hypothetical protein